MLKQSLTLLIKGLCISTLILSSMNVALAASDDKKAEVFDHIKASVAASIKTAVSACQSDQSILGVDECKKHSPLIGKQSHIETCIDQNILRCVGNKLVAENPAKETSK